jgi:hypothetical protein
MISSDPKILTDGNYKINAGAIIFPLKEKIVSIES